MYVIPMGYVVGDLLSNSSGMVNHQFLRSTVNDQGRLQTNPLVTFPSHRSFSSQQAVVLDVGDRVFPAAGMEPLNHAYLFMDVGRCVIIPQMVTFSDTRLTDIYNKPSRNPALDNVRCARVSHDEYSRLTDYLGCIRPISNAIPFGDATTGQKYLRKLDIETLEFKRKYDKNPPLQIVNYRYDNGIYTCEDHGKQIPPTYRYNINCSIADGTPIAEFTFFYQGSRKDYIYHLVRCFKKVSTNREEPFAIELVNIVGENHIFQIQFTCNTQKGDGRLIVTDFLDIQPDNERHSLVQPSATTDRELQPTEPKLSTITTVAAHGSTSIDTNTPGSLHMHLFNWSLQTKKTKKKKAN